MFLKSGAILVPTLSTLFSVLELGEELNLGRKQREEMNENAPLWIESTKPAHAAGVPIAAGGDIGNRYPHGSNARELELLCKIGLSPMEAILATTSVAARTFRGDDRVGTLREGMQADLIVIDGNPLDNIAVLQDRTKLLLVLKEGKPVR